MPAADYQTIGH